MAQVCGVGPRVGGRLTLFCIHRVNRVYGDLVVTSWTCYSYRIIVIIYNNPDFQSGLNSTELSQCPQLKKTVTKSE